MAKVYLDANILIDIAKRRKPLDFANFKGHDLFTSPLSFHILIYVAKYKIPSQKINNLKEYLELVDFNEKIVDAALTGPTVDFEDNVQLHSAAEEDCNLFLTSDKKILAMKFFGKVKIAGEISLDG